MDLIRNNQIKSNYNWCIRFNMLKNSWCYRRSTNFFFVGGLWSCALKLEKDYIGNFSWMHRPWFFSKSDGRNNAIAKTLRIVRCKIKVQWKCITVTCKLKEKKKNQISLYIPLQVLSQMYLMYSWENIISVPIRWEVMYAYYGRNVLEEIHRSQGEFYHDSLINRIVKVLIR